MNIKILEYHPGAFDLWAEVRVQSHTILSVFEYIRLGIIKCNYEGQRTHHIHMFEVDSELLDRIYFLRSSSALRKHSKQ